jgi:hypothetical protein
MGNNTTLTNATIALVIVTALLVIVTGVYTWQTKRIVKEMETGRKLGLMPVLTCEVECDPARTISVVGEYNNVLIENVGDAPALMTNVKLELANPARSVLDIQSQTWPVGILGVKQKKSIPMNRATLKMFGRDAQPKVTVTLTYENVYKKSFTTVTTLELNVPHPVEDHPMGIWVKLDEQTSFI